MKTWFITGISRGLGLALAKSALDQGDTVWGTVRGVAPALPTSDQLHVLQLDVADSAAVAATVNDAFARAGRIDVVVNNAGYGLLGALEHATEEELQHLFAVDIFGPIRVVRAALPHLRKQGGGHILNVTSIAGRAPGAGAALYAAAKASIEGLSAALAQELAPLGIKVTAIAPGAFRTDFLTARSIRKSGASDAYADSVGKGVAAFEAMDGKQLGDPYRAAKAILALVASPVPPVHLLLGTDALTRTRAKLDAVNMEMKAWEAVTKSTDFPS